jgi:membrane fusion protein (multidrug efflux system)
MTPSLLTPKKTLIAIVGAAVLAIALICGWLFSTSTDQTTNDAFISADYTLVTPRISGQITHVRVEDNQYVHQGQPMIDIDDRDLRAALDAAKANLLVQQATVANAEASLIQQQSNIHQAAATLAASQATYVFAKADFARYLDLAAQGAGSKQNAQQARSRIDTAQANVARDSASLEAARQKTAILLAERERATGELKRAQAALDAAELNLSYTQIVAPVDGWVGQRVARQGAYVTPGNTLLALVPLKRAYVIGNFQETQLEHVRPGQPVDIRVDSFGGATLHGVVDSFAPATGVTFSPIAPDNATGNFTKVVQRIPVKIVLDAGQREASRLLVGMAVEATVHTAATAGSRP